MKPLRILIVDDHELLRRGLRSLLEAHAGWEVCGEAVTGREAVALARQLQPDLVLMDITMPELNGVEATRQILKSVPDAQVLILTMHQSETLVRKALEAGARGFVLKSDASQSLVAALEALARHRPFFSATVSEVMLRNYLQQARPATRRRLSESRLSPREIEIVQLLAEGKTNKEVAGALGVSVRTVESHRSNIMHRLELKTLSELVRYAIRNEIVEL